ncbi:DELTA-alicitoxin-Pse2b isoform X1 [Nematostella vectensis]|uniref:DELTA-alicitoxin-Pse2b isoform X1 n=1 Tax=Nematostella vectensis TaxID=45351 RepID=UPI002076D726|nr:DELTA-alicitoxin-Pse2b isoform X1 [Nematostella vectensis]
MWNIALFLTLLVTLCLLPTAYGNEAIGRGYYLNGVDFIAKPLSGSAGKQVFDDVSINCVEEPAKERRTGQTETYYGSNEDFYSNTAFAVGLEEDVNLAYTFESTLQALSHNSAADKLNGYLMDYHSYIKSKQIIPRCLKNFEPTEEFSDDFDALPSKVSNPGSPASWAKYKSFLRKYGSHVVKEVIYGVSLQIYYFADEARKYTSSDYRVYACEKLAAPQSNSADFMNVCFKVTNKEKQEAANFEISEKKVIRGGTESTRSKLLTGVTQSLINTFTEDEADNHATAVQYKFIAIWDLLSLKYLEPEDKTKTVNLKTYYEKYAD